MALDDCDPCGCIPQNISNDKFKQSVLEVLCSILTATQDPGAGLLITAVPEKSIAFGSITGSFVNTSFVPADTNPVTLKFINTTDVDIDVSTDNSTTWLTVLSGGSEDFNFLPGRLFTSSIYIKSNAGTATIGSFKIQGSVADA